MVPLLTAIVTHARLRLTYILMRAWLSRYDASVTALHNDGSCSLLYTECAGWKACTDTLLAEDITPHTVRRPLAWRAAQAALPQCLALLEVRYNPFGRARINM